MSSPLYITVWFIVSFLFAFTGRGTAQVLFNGALGLPTSQGWIYAATGGAQTLSNNAVRLDTSGANAYQAGYSVITSPLNRTNGFTLLFTSQILSESHASTNRAGFSVIVLANDHRGLELAFWSSNIFAQSASPLFTQAEGTNYPTTNLVTYGLTFHPTNYLLTANGTPILTGPVRDYSAFSGFPNPYSSTNFLFFGDDTTSASATVILQQVTLVTAPHLVAASDRLIRWTGVPNLGYTVQSSSNLTSWAAVGSASSSNGQITFTNSVANGPIYFRVVYP